MLLSYQKTQAGRVLEVDTKGRDRGGNLYRQRGVLSAFQEALALFGGALENPCAHVNSAEPSSPSTTMATISPPPSKRHRLSPTPGIGVASVPATSSPPATSSTFPSSLQLVRRQPFSPHLSHPDQLQSYREMMSASLPGISTESLRSFSPLSRISSDLPKDHSHDLDHPPRAMPPHRQISVLVSSDGNGHR